MRTSDLRVFRYREDKRDTDVIRVSGEAGREDRLCAAGVSDEGRRRVGDVMPNCKIFDTPRFTAPG